MNKYFIAVLALGISGWVLAAEASAKKEGCTKSKMDSTQHFQRLDQDGSGSISLEEAKSHPRLAKDFEAVDTNKDGQVTEAEYRTHAQQHREQHRAKAKTEMKARWDKADANGDGALSRDEAQASPHLAKKFDAIDADKNGQISQEEIAEYMKSHRRSEAGRQS